MIASVPVIFSTVRYDDADLKDAGIWALKQKGVMTLKAEDHGWEVDPRLDFRKTDTSPLQEICVLLLWHRPCTAAARPPN